MDKVLTLSRREMFSIDLNDRTPALQVTGSSVSETPISKIDRRLYFGAFRPFTTQGVEHRGLVRKTWRNGLRWLAVHVRWLLRYIDLAGAVFCRTRDPLYIHTF